MDKCGAAWQGRNEPFGYQPARKIARTDVSIGAGDGFNGGLIAALAKGEPLASAVDTAQGVAAAIVENGRGVMGWGQGI